MHCGYIVIYFVLGALSFHTVSVTRKPCDKDADSWFESLGNLTRENWRRIIIIIINLYLHTKSYHIYMVFLGAM